MVNPLSNAYVANVGPCFLVSVHQANTIQWEYASIVNYAKTKKILLF